MRQILILLKVPSIISADFSDNQVDNLNIRKKEKKEWIPTALLHQICLNR